jgi:hypothetical protein
MELGQVDPERLVRCALRKTLLLYFCLKQQMSTYLVEMLCLVTTTWSLVLVSQGFVFSCCTNFSCIYQKEISLIESCGATTK